MNKLYTTLTAGLLIAGMAQAALVSEIDGATAATDWSDEVFTGSVTTTVNNWGINDNFTDASFAGTTMNLGNGTAVANQPFVNSITTGADFTGATFNWNPYTLNGGTRFNIFRNATAGTGTVNAGMKFNNSIWNINIAGTSLNTLQIFLDGAGSITAGTAANALDMSGVDFNFTGTTSLSTTAGTAIIANLSESTAGFGNGAKYDTAFTTNNYAAFGYGDAAALDTALQTAGWQVVPEPSSYALLAGLLGMSYVMVRRRK
ncbi:MULTISPECIES: PEP-CTERM sorting domain-containing protein [unclassified Lentimonas]|uniref:PEP-CTERM sorting domain-containing protein n=1 Tax=unclassified Lentimonas TaxID=2630993 RepID=UPI00132712CD|nr:MULTISPECIES: PEP-CTERM sorting domain-containing protein [unclassified Lentimonas]CAA6677715.1 Unannotated [Lentimonas sp. CC4]CAA6684978.1 Unannotated [Lentimonas sp. CC6]CAA7077907.1 Unannotated [Lentimonas sp. CC4]CAA7169831.1 Unannotated [Lentimonas sp. CC21]CAA7179950.1 Unannotated [Lentimonas sp. CC8]